MKATRKGSLFIFLLSFVVSSLSAHTVHISTPEDYAALVANVNSGATHAGTTVYLAADLDLSSLGATDPLGKSPATPFLGTLDGQGHVVRNLTIASPHASVGMVGFADDPRGGSSEEDGGGAAVRNLVLDAATTVQSTCPGDAHPWLFLAAVLGSCTASGRPCRVEGCVSLASVVFAGSNNNTITITNSSTAVAVGSMLGGCDGAAHGCVVANCVNYGTVANHGAAAVMSASYVGGVVGVLRNDRHAATGAEACVRGCFNYGALVADGSAAPGRLAMGGVLGAGHEGTAVYGCVGAGTYANETPADVGGIAGTLTGGASVAYGFWRNDVWGAAVGSTLGAGEAAPAVSESQGFEFPSLVLEWGSAEDGIGGGGDASLWDALTTAVEAEADAMAGSAELCRVECVLNGGEFEPGLPDPLIIVVVAVVGPAALALPVPVKKGAEFRGWFADPELEEPADLSAVNASGEVALYAKWAYTISFEAGDGGSEGATFRPITSAAGEVIVLPNATGRCGYTFAGWRPESPVLNGMYGGGTPFTTPGHEVTFVAQYAPNDYFLDFYSWDGSLVEGGVRVGFGATVNSSYFPAWNKTKGDFVFDGWGLDSSEGSELLDQYNRDKSFAMPCRNLTLTAQLISDTVKIVFTSVMTDNDVNIFVDRIYTKRLNTYDIVEIGEEEGTVGTVGTEAKSYAVILFESGPAARKFYNAMGKWVTRGYLSYYSYEPHFVKAFYEASFSATNFPPPPRFLLPLSHNVLLFIIAMLSSSLPFSLHSR